MVASGGPTLPGNPHPLCPLSLRASKGEGEIRTEAYALCFSTVRMPLVQYYGEEERMDSRQSALSAGSGAGGR